MRRLLISTTALAVALYGLPPMPLMAQDACTPGVDCPEDKAAAEAAAAQAQAEAEAAAAAAQAQAEAEAAAAAAQAQAEAEAAAAAAQAQADAEAAAAAARAQAEAEAAAAAQAQAEAEAAAAQAEQEAIVETEQEVPDAAQVQPETRTQATADVAIPEAQPEADAATALAQEEAEAKAKAVAAEAAQDALSAAEAKARADASRAQDEADSAAAALANVRASDAAYKAEADARAKAAAAEQALKDAEAAAGTVAIPEGNSAEPVSPELTTVEPTTAEPVTPEPATPETTTTVTTDPVAPPPVADSTVLPEPPKEAVETLETLLTTPPETTTAPADPTAPIVVLAPDAALLSTDSAAPSVEATTTETTITAADTRSSNQEFAGQTRDRARPRDRDEGLSDLEKVGLVALGALVVGAILKNGDRVEQNTGDRVVLQRDDGSYVVLKDDDTLLRRPGSNVRTETFRDGSTRTFVRRADGTEVVTIRDASGRVLRRSAIDARGREVLLIDDLAPVRPIDVTTLPRPRKPITISTSNTDLSLATAMAAIRGRDDARGYSLRQVREIREVRALAPVLDVEPITFATGSSAIDPAEAQKLAELGGLIVDLIEKRPNELFLVEGHTDAVGSAASNLALSDRRAESLALALTEYFGVPPENLVVQGYGESDLLIPTDGNEPRNRRVAVRLISPLLQASLN